MFPTSVCHKGSPSRLPTTGARALRSLLAVSFLLPNLTGAVPAALTIDAAAQAITGATALPTETATPAAESPIPDGASSSAQLYLPLIMRDGGATPPEPPVEEQPTTIPDQAPIIADLHSAPVMFIENVGQFPVPASLADNARPRFQVRGAGGTIYLAPNAMWVTLLEALRLPEAITATAGSDPLYPVSPEISRTVVNLRFTFVGSNSNPQVVGFDPLDTTVSYFIGSDPSPWHPDVPVWGSVRYVDLYPGLDLEITSDHGQWAWRLVAKAGADLGPTGPLPNVSLRVEGADSLAVVGPTGVASTSVRMTTGVGEFSLPLLEVVDAEGALLTADALSAANVASTPTLSADQVTAPFAALHAGGQHRRPSGLQKPAVRPASAIAGRSRAAASLSLDSNQSDLVYSTFLGGSNFENGILIGGIAIDGNGAAYVTGATASTDFPTTPGAFDTTFNGGSYDIFISKLNATGTALVYSTFLGGGGPDYGGRITIDGSETVYVFGTTESSDFPTTSGAFDTTFNGGRDGFVTKLNATGTALVYSTYLGGIGTDEPGGGAVDGSGAAYVTGVTWSSDFPTTPGAFDTTFGGWPYDGFVAKLNATGTALIYSTFLGGSNGDDVGRGIAVDESGAAYVTGETTSTDFPTTPGAYDTSRSDGGVAGPWDVFITKLNATGTALAYSTYVGGTDTDYALGGIAIDGSGTAHVTGQTYATDYPTTPGAFDTTFNGGAVDAFITKLNASGTALLYSTYVGGSANETGGDITVNESGVAYMTGQTTSTDFPLPRTLSIRPSTAPWLLSSPS